MERALLDIILGPAGVTVLLLFAVITGWRGWWVFGWQYKELRRERDEWKQAALRALSGAETAAEIGHALVEHTVEEQKRNDAR